jgi:hypothetical protein
VEVAMFFWSLPAPLWGFFFALAAFILAKLALPEADWDNTTGICCIALPVWLASTALIARLQGTNEGLGTLIKDTIEDIKEDPAEWIASLFR